MMPVRYEVHERIAIVTLDRPEAMNSLDPEVIGRELNDAFPTGQYRSGHPRRHPDGGR